VGARKSAWQTLDLFALAPTSYGATPRAIVPLAGRLVVAGLAVAGGGADDYQWVERWQTGKGKWTTRRYQLETGLSTMAQDAAPTATGIAVLAIGQTSQGNTLVVRESTAAGRFPQVVLTLPGISDMWAARLAVGRDVAAVVAMTAGHPTAVGCALR
jgi:hypothetical protein